MNTKTPTTAAELLRGYYELKIESDAYETFGCADAMEQIEFDATMQKIDAIAARLDEMCEDAGIYLQESGYFRYLKYEFDYIGHGRDTYKMACLRDCSARDQQALQEWLLIKENHGK